MSYKRGHKNNNDLCLVSDSGSKLHLQNPAQRNSVDTFAESNRQKSQSLQREGFRRTGAQIISENDMPAAIGQAIMTYFATHDESVIDKSGAVAINENLVRYEGYLIEYYRQEVCFADNKNNYSRDWFRVEKI